MYLFPKSSFPVACTGFNLGIPKISKFNKTQIIWFWDKL